MRQARKAIIGLDGILKQINDVALKEDRLDGKKDSQRTVFCSRSLSLLRRWTSK